MNEPAMKETLSNKALTAEELKLIVSTSRGLGYLPEAGEDMIHRVLDLGARGVGRVVPGDRPEHDRGVFDRPGDRPGMVELP